MMMSLILTACIVVIATVVVVPFDWLTKGSLIFLLVSTCAPGTILIRLVTHHPIKLKSYYWSLAQFMFVVMCVGSLGYAIGIYFGPLLALGTEILLLLITWLIPQILYGRNISDDLHKIKGFIRK